MREFFAKFTFSCKNKQKIIKKKAQSLPFVKRSNNGIMGTASSVLYNLH